MKKILDFKEQSNPEDTYPDDDIFIDDFDSNVAVMEPQQSEGEEPTLKDLEAIALEESGGEKVQDLKQEVTKEMCDVIDPDGTLRKKGILNDLTQKDLLNLYEVITKSTPKSEEQEDTLSPSRLEVRGVPLLNIQKYGSGPFEELVQEKQRYLSETRNAEKSLIQEDEHHTQDYNATVRYNALLRKHSYLNLGEMVFRKHLKPTQIKNLIEFPSTIRMTARTMKDPKPFVYVENHARFTSQNYKAHVAAGLATYGHYEGQPFEKAPVVGLYLPTKEHAVRIASAIVGGMCKYRYGSFRNEDDIIAYNTAIQIGIETMRFHLDEENDAWYMSLATYHPEQARLLLDHILVKLMEKEVIAARMFTTENNGDLMNGVYLALTPPYLLKKGNTLQLTQYHPKFFTGSFLLEQRNFYKPIQNPTQ